MLANLLSAYDWFDHPDGPKFVETHRDPFRSVGHWLFQPGAFSSFHRVNNNEEVWLVHAGKVWVHVLSPEGGYQLLRVGLDLAAGERPVVTVPAGYWQAAELAPGEPFAFGSNVCAPGFTYEQFEIAKRESLLAAYPQHKEVILRLTRAE